MVALLLFILSFFCFSSLSDDMLMDAAHSAIFQGMIGAQKKPFMAKQTGFEQLRHVLTNGEGALSTVRNGNMNPLKDRKKKNLTTWLDHNHNYTAV